MTNFTVQNNLQNTVVVYTTITNVNPDSPSTNPDDYIPVYTRQGTVDAGKLGNFSTSDAIARVVVTREIDQFPLKVSVAAEWDPGSKSITVQSTDETVAVSAWTFYKTFSSQPYSPVALQFNDLVINTDVTKLDSTAAAFFTANGYQGVDFALFTSLSYWATNLLYAFPGTYYCYEPPTGSMGFILPKTLIGQLVIQNGTATYTPADGSAAVALTFEGTKLSSQGSGPNSGIVLTAIIRDLTWEGSPEIVTWGFVGTNAGKQMIAQSYENPQVPWYAVAYDMVYGAFFTVQVGMALKAAYDLLMAAGKGAQWLVENAGKLAGNVRDWLNSTGDSAGADSAVGDAADPVNVDVDIDIDIDVDVDIDIDIDIDVDVDIDVDIDVDFVWVVDVDVDVDVNIDVVTDTDIDIDIDVDTDVDTNVDVEPGMIRGLLSKVGSWIMEKALPTLLEALVIQVAFMTISDILAAWKKADEKGMANLQPRESTGLGLLINYMLNENKSIQERWNTFADYAQFSKADPVTLELSVTIILTTGNAAADADYAKWRWSTDDENAVVNTLKQYSATDAYKAFQILGTQTYHGNALPLKVGAAVAMKYLKSL